MGDIRPAGGADPLSPVQFLERAAHHFAARQAVIDGERVVSYAELWDRCRRLGGHLRERGVGAGDRVAVLALNSLPLLEAHYGVPHSGAALVALNTRLNPHEIAAILDHCQPSVFVVDDRLAGLADRALSACTASPATVRVGGVSDEYEAALAGAPALEPEGLDERSLLSINYTSGTTGRPKGVMYSHRGAFLQALAVIHHAHLGMESVFLWTLPMFHCNGWCFTWGVTAAGGTHVCLERPEPQRTWELVRRHGVTHFNCAPTVLSDLLAGPQQTPTAGSAKVRVQVGGAPPSPALLRRAAEYGIDVTHLYGLTETYGPAVVCEWQPDWDGRDEGERAVLKARQGIGTVVTTSLRVLDERGLDVLPDGSSAGEIAIRGNNVMLGYYLDEEATRRAIPDGWFRTGDLGVCHPDGYVELTDRAKDVIVSGGENIASVEVERVLAAHPAVLEAAVVAAPDLRWGEVPAAFVTLRDGAAASEGELSGFVRDHLAGFKIPRRICFGPLPRTSTGKVQKQRLRERARELWPASDDAATTFLGPSPTSTPVTRT
ncbi:MAG TPA: AMP-binding protein [Candidatus Dormibacteraeota bacterium]